MPIAVDTLSTDIGPGEMTGEQLALPTSGRVTAHTRYGDIKGGRVKNGCQVFLNVPYGVNVPRWTDPQPLPDDYQYPHNEYTVDGLYCAQPDRPYTLQRFLGSQSPKVEGNFGFKDCWQGLQWVKENIASFGGDPDQIHLSGLSGGAHLVHQLLHQAARLAPQPSPFVTALLQSNAILTNPLAPSTRDEQFQAFCEQLRIDHTLPDILEQLRDTTKFPTQAVISAVQSMGNLCTFRGVIGTDGWNRADEMEYQQSGRMAADLKSAGVRCVIMGDVRDEDFFYSYVHPCQGPSDILPNLERYYPAEQSKRLLAAYPALAVDASPAECDRLQGRILADGQVHLPARLLAKDLVAGGMPVVRYAVEFVAEKLNSNALENAIGPAVRMDGTFVQRGEEEMLALNKDGSTAWKSDWRWPLLRAAEKAVRG
ncbi:hypothetical protein P7C73_g460, partial [Tremellales sp. Uapishka_1]